MVALIPHRADAATPAVPARGPRAEVERVDALSCTAAAVERVGDHCVCADHQREVRLAYWGTDANLILRKILPNEYFQCGDVYSAPEVSRG